MWLIRGGRVLSTPFSWRPWTYLSNVDGEASTNYQLDTQARLSYIDWVIGECQARSRCSEHCSNWMEASWPSTRNDTAL